MRSNFWIIFVLKTPLNKEYPSFSSHSMLFISTLLPSCWMKCISHNPEEGRSKHGERGLCREALGPSTEDLAQSRERRLPREHTVQLGGPCWAGKQLINYSSCFSRRWLLRWNTWLYSSDPGEHLFSHIRCCLSTSTPKWGPFFLVQMHCWSSSSILPVLYPSAMYISYLTELQN